MVLGASVFIFTKVGEETQNGIHAKQPKIICIAPIIMADFIGV